MLETDLSRVTHVYVASLCMPDALMDGLWAVLQRDAPRLQARAYVLSWMDGWMDR